MGTMGNSAGTTAVKTAESSETPKRAIRITDSVYVAVTITFGGILVRKNAKLDATDLFVTIPLVHVHMDASTSIMAIVVIHNVAETVTQETMLPPGEHVMKLMDNVFSDVHRVGLELRVLINAADSAMGPLAREATAHVH